MEGDGQIAPTNDDDCPIIYRIVTKTVLRMCLVDDVVQVFAMKCHSIKSMWSAGHLLDGAGGGGPREHDTKRVCAGTTVSDSWSSEGRPGFVSS